MKRKPPPACDHIRCFFISPRVVTSGPICVSFDLAEVTLPLHDHSHHCFTPVIGRLTILSNLWLTSVNIVCATSPLKLYAVGGRAEKKTFVNDRGWCRSRLLHVRSQNTELQIPCVYLLQGRLGNAFVKIHS